MGKLITYEQYLNMLAEKSSDNTRQLRRGVKQRRNGMEDLYGVPFSANGDASSPATFYISLSPDCVYLQRFAFKFVIRPFTTTIKGATESTLVNVIGESLTIINGTAINPNPHAHGTYPHSHNVVNGMAFVNTTSTNWSVKIAGVDITPYLIAQHGGAWINGEGVYPTNELQGREDFYDILDVASVLTAEGKIAERDLILAPNFKKVEIVSDAPFGADCYLYLKYSNLNR